MVKVARAVPVGARPAAVKATRHGNPSEPRPGHYDAPRRHAFGMSRAPIAAPANRRHIPTLAGHSLIPFRLSASVRRSSQPSR